VQQPSAGDTVTTQTETDEAVVIRWGQHAGKTLGELPSSYLLWLAGNARQEDICEAADRLWKWREKYGEHE